MRGVPTHRRAGVPPKKQWPVWSTGTCRTTTRRVDHELPHLGLSDQRVGTDCEVLHVLQITTF